MKTNKIIGLLGIATLLGACGGAADEMLTGLDESQITTSISCAADGLRAATSKSDGGGRSMVPSAEPVASDGGGRAPVESDGGGRVAVPSNESVPSDGGGRSMVPSAEPVASDGGGRAPVESAGGGRTAASVTIALSSSLGCDTYKVGVTGTDVVDADAILIEGSNTEASVVVEDGTFEYSFTTMNLGDLELTKF